MNYVEEIMRMLAASHSCFHNVALIEEQLRKNGFEKKAEGEPFHLERGKKYYVTRNGSSLIAFKLGDNPRCFRLAAAHTDSPSFKLKPNPIISFKNLAKLNVEPYGGALFAPWFDRALSFAGRAMVERKGKFVQVLIDVDEDLLVIPNVCIHMKREINQDSINPAVDTIPLLGEYSEGLDMDGLLKSKGLLGEEDKLIGFDFFLYDRDLPKLVGANKELLLAPRLDDLSSCYSALLGFIEADNSGDVDVFCAFDNEEVGSLSRQGANSTFLQDILHRIGAALDKNEDEFLAMVANGFLLSEDNAHANHPNHPELSDATTDVRLNGGIVVKYNANQKYTTDSYSAALVKWLCAQIGSPVQEYTNRSDLRGGSTLGNISNSEISFAAADIGLAQLAMHSCNETMGVRDLERNVALNKAYFSLPWRLKEGIIEFGE